MVGTHQNDTLDTFPADTSVTLFPGIYGGVETPMAYADGIVYVPVTNLSSDYTATTAPTAVDFTSATGELDAIDASTGALLWTADLDAANFGAATVAGDVVFTSTFSGEVLGFDRTSGEQGFSWQAPAGINAFMSVAGDTLLVPVGLGDTPELVALRPGATSQPAAPANPPAAAPTPGPVAPAPAPAPPVAAPAPGPLQLSISSPASPPLTFDTTTLTAAAGAQVTVTYTNDSNIAHNWHLFNGPDASSPSLASTPVKSGPGDVETMQFTAPTEAGSYFFWCDVHTTIMTGQFVVTAP